MIEIQKCPFSDIERVFESYVRKNNSQFVCVIDNGKILEFSEYIINDDVLEIVYFSNISNDFYLTDALVKTLIFYADLEKIRYITMQNKLFDCPGKYNFVFNDNKYILDIFNQNKKQCSCK